MKKRLFIIVAVIGICVVTGIGITWQRSGNYYYHGKALKTWSLQAYRGDRHSVAALKAMGPKAVPHLIELLRMQDSSLRKRTWSYFPSLPQNLRLLAWKKVGPPNAVVTREAAAGALGIIGPDARAAVPALAGALRDKQGNVCWVAAISLGCIGKDSLQALVGALEDADSNVRHAAASALGQLGPEADAAIPALIQSLTDSNETVRASAAYSLSRTGPSGWFALVDASAHGRDIMRQTAQQTLERLNGAGEGALPVLVKLAHDETPGIRRHAIESLGTLRAGSPLARKALLGALQDPAIEVRLAAVTVLGEKGERARYAVAGLSECLKDQEEIVRAAAKEALGKIDGGEPVVAPSPPSREPIW